MTDPVNENLDLSKLTHQQLAELARVLTEQYDLYREDQLNFYVPHETQKKFHFSDAKIRLFVGGNRSGKTTASVIESIWLCLGIHPNHKRKIPVKGKLYADSFPMLMDTFFPKFKQWLHPKNLDEKKPYVYNNTGHLIGINFANGSSLRFGSYDQEERKSEGSDWDFVGFDEPPSRSLYIANLRGTIDRKGLIWFTCTPLSELWMYEELYLPGLTGDKDRIETFQCSSYDNPHVDAVDVAFLEQELTEEERKVRIYGHFPKIQGVVIDTYESHESDIDPFTIDENYVVYEGLDPHPSKPNCALWKAVDRDGNRFVCRELKFDGGIYDWGQEIARVREEFRKNGCRVVESVIDTSINQKDVRSKVNQYDELRGSLMDAGENLLPKLVNKKNWLDGGIAKLKDLYRVVDVGNGDRKPKQYVFKDCVKYKRELITYVWAGDIERDGVKPKPVNNDLLDCFEDGTEVLTKNGFKLFKDVVFSDLIATVNPSTDLIEYQNPTEIINKPYEGSVIRIHGKSFDLSVTPNHRMVIYSDRLSDKSRIVLAKNLKKTNALKFSATWDGIDYKSFKIPGVKCKNNKKLREDIIIDNIESLFSFFGWFVSEGFVCNPQFPGRGWQVCISQVKKNNRVKIEKVLDDLGFNWSYRGHSYQITDKRLWHFLHDNFGRYAWFKKCPEFIKNASPKLISIFLESAIDGDGWRQGKSENYSTTSIQLANDIQELFFKAGFSSSIKTRHGLGGKDRDGRVFKAKRPIYIIRKSLTKKKLLHGRRINGVTQPIFKNDFYVGNVGCVTVPNGQIIVRKDGVIFVCGNCDRYIESLAPSYQTPGAKAFYRYADRDAYFRKAKR